VTGATAGNQKPEIRTADLRIRKNPGRPRHPRSNSLRPRFARVATDYREAFGVRRFCAAFGPRVSVRKSATELAHSKRFAMKASRLRCLARHFSGKDEVPRGENIEDSRSWQQLGGALFIGVNPWLINSFFQVK
jgi:hypothetical protein